MVKTPPFHGGNMGSSPVRVTKNGAVKKVPRKRQAVPKGAACKIFVEKGLVQWKNQPFGGIMDL